MTASGNGGGDDGEVVADAPAKINLYLHVRGRRGDGRHNVDTLIAFADIADRVRVRPARALTLEVGGPFAAALGPPGDNLALRAARALAQAAQVRSGAAILLEKRLPVAAGLGGGSADAAAVLRALAALWRLEVPASRLRRIAAALGADVPACLAGGVLRAAGAGDILYRAPPFARPPALALVNPGVAVSTADVFSRLRAPFPPPAPRRSGRVGGGANAAVRALAGRRNDLEAPARRIAPAIGDALRALESTPGCLLARMSGSGATCFGLYPTDAEARRAAAALRRRRPGWWVRAARMSAGSAPRRARPGDDEDCDGDEDRGEDRR